MGVSLLLGRFCVAWRVEVIAVAGHNGFPQEPSCRDERPHETNENCPPILDLLSLSARIHAADRLKSVPLLATSI
jgi:hypothetical protein